MKRIRRVILWTSLSTAALSALLFLICIDRVDQRDHRELAGFAATTYAVNAPEGRMSRPVGQLRAGFGRARLTPRLGASQEDYIQGRFHSLPLAGYGKREGQPATGIHDELNIKAVAFEVQSQRCVLASADLLIIPPGIADAVAKRLEGEGRLQRGELYLGATHTHCGIGGWGEGFVEELFAGPYHPGVGVWIEQQMYTAVVTALEDLEIAKLGRTRFSAPQWVRNRLVGEEGQLNDNFDLLYVEQTDGDRALLGVYGAHATVLSAEGMELSGGYPGYWQRAIEQTPNTLALFFAGAVGSHSPQPPTNGFEGARQMGEALAKATWTACDQIELRDQVEMSILAFQLQLPELQIRLSDQLRLRPWIARQLLNTKPTALLQAVRLDQVVWISTPCDFSGELALELAAFAEPISLATVFTSFNGDYIGYVLPSRHADRPGYETRTMAFYGPAMGGYLAGMIELALEKLAGPALDPVTDRQSTK